METLEEARGQVKRLKHTVEELEEENEELRTRVRVLSAKLNNCINSKDT